jgi:hypothetical protein
MMDITKALKAHGFNKKQIDSFMFYYDTAVKMEVPYPLYYAFVNIVS